MPALFSQAGYLQVQQSKVKSALYIMAVLVTKLNEIQKHWN